MNKRFVILFLFASSFFAHGQEVSWSLQKCFEVALKNNIEIKIKQLEVLRARKNYTHPLLELIPNVSFTANHSYNFGSTIDPSTNSRVSSDIQWDFMNLNANVNVLDFSNLATASKNKLAIELSKADREVVEYEYKLRLLEKYFEVLYTQEQLKIQKRQLTLSDQNLIRIQKEVEIGSKPTSDLYDMQFQFSQEENQVLMSEQLYDYQKKELFQWMNVQEINTENIVLEPYFATNSNENDTEIIYNPKLNFMEINHENTIKDVRILRGNNLPTLSAFYGFSTFYSAPINQPNLIVDGFRTQFDNNKYQQAGLQLQIPIFNGFKNQRNIAAAKIQTDKAKWEAEQEKIKIEQQLELEKKQKQNYALRSEKLRKSLELANKMLTTSQAKFLSGKTDAVVFSTVKNQHLTAEYEVLKNDLLLQYVSIRIHLLTTNQL
jgi:outer membrane protein